MEPYIDPNAPWIDCKSCGKRHRDSDYRPGEKPDAMPSADLRSLRERLRLQGEPVDENTDKDHADKGADPLPFATCCPRSYPHDHPSPYVVINCGRADFPHAHRADTDFCPLPDIQPSHDPHGDRCPICARQSAYTITVYGHADGSTHAKRQER